MFLKFDNFAAPFPGRYANVYLYVTMPFVYLPLYYKIKISLWSLQFIKVVSQSQVAPLALTVISRSGDRCAGTCSNNSFLSIAASRYVDSPIVATEGPRK
jgi:hypothetical protein